MKANERQVGGTHYQKVGGKPQHWDWAADMPYLEGRATAYIERHQRKNGMADIEKALHFLQKIAEVRYGVVVDVRVYNVEETVDYQNPYANVCADRE